MNSSEVEFLNGIATQLKLSGKVLEVFLVCFSPDNQSLEEEELAKKISWGINACTKPQDAMRPHLGNIYKRLAEDLNCPDFPHGNTPGRPKGNISKLQHYFNWIWETKYAEHLAAQPEARGEIDRHPFGDRGRIEDPDRLFGRQEFLRRLEEDLSHGTSISLVGETQIGKSSILRYLCQRGTHRWREKPSQFIYMDMQLIDRDEDFYAALCELLNIDPPCSTFQLERQLKQRRCKYILCVDEIEVLGGEKFSFNVRKNLRGLADGDDTPLILVTASRSPLSILFPDSPTQTSPLAGFCQQRDVKEFTQAETIDFIQYRLTETSVNFTDEQIAELYRQTNGHPAKLQRAAAELFDSIRGMGNS
jgi:AAA domain